MLQSPFFITFIIALGVNLFFFVLAFANKTDKFTDFTYGLTFILLTTYLLLTNTISTSKLVLTFMIVAWAIRLISYLLARILKIKKDSRFDDKRDDLVVFLQFWFFQGLAVWFIMLPPTHFFTQPVGATLSAVSLAGIVIWFLGLLIETIADLQKFTFKNKPENKDLWIQSGLWKYSRHPNYFGEMLVWWGIFIFVSPTISGWAWLTIAGPIFITYILMFVSGIPLLEQKYDKKYANNLEYQRYKESTSLLIPLPPKR